MKKLLVSIVIICAGLPFALPSINPNVVRASISDANTVELPIVMYHSVLKSRQSKYVVSPAQLEQDFQAYADMGYTPIFLRDAVDFVDGKGTLPEKPMVITFDDGHYNNLHYVLPIAEKFNFKIVISPVTSFGDEERNPNYSYLSPSQCAELEKSGLVEIGNHTHDMHKFKPRYGIKKNGESIDEYKEILQKDIRTAQDILVSNGVTQPTTFAYPFGAYNEAARDVLIAMGFRAFLTCNETVSKITVGEPESLYCLGRYNRSGNDTTENFVKKVFKKL